MADKELLSEAQEAFKLSAENEDDNRKTALADIKFSRLGEQWPEGLKNKRLFKDTPCLVINRMNPMIDQVVNDARQNKPAIKVHPADSRADIQTAQIYNGLIRHVEVSSKADQAYDTALEHATAGGFGYFEITTDYACDDTFDLDILIKRIANQFSVYGDPYSTEADSSDWNSAFVVDRVPKDEFEKRFKGAEQVNWEAEGYTGLSAPWIDDDDILIAKWWRREKVKKNVLLLSDNQVLSEKLYKERKDELDAIGITVLKEREIQAHKVTWTLLTGAEVLEQPTEWAGKYIPIVPVYGKEINVEGKRYFRALIHDAIDPQKMLNFFRTMSTELVSLWPKVPFIGPVGSFETDQAKWETANTESHAYIEYDVKPGANPPQRQSFAGVPAGALQEALNASDDIKSTIGMYDASLGARSNETSGKAIMARQREGDISTFHFIDNLARAIEHAGRIIIDLIPHVYTGERMIRILGQDDTATTIQLGKPTQVMGPDGKPQLDAQGVPVSRIYDLGVGKYDLTVETGPSFTTRREEAAFEMTEFVRAFPASAPVVGPRIAKNSDWPEADSIATELKQLAQAITQGQGKPVDPAQAQAEVAVAQMEMRVKQLEIQVKAFEAETKRMEAMNDMAEQRHRMLNPAPQPQPQPRSAQPRSAQGY